MQNTDMVQVDFRALKIEGEPVRFLKSASSLQICQEYRTKCENGKWVAGQPGQRRFFHCIEKIET